MTRWTSQARDIHNPDLNTTHHFLKIVVKIVLMIIIYSNQILLVDNIIHIFVDLRKSKIFEYVFKLTITMVLFIYCR